MSAKVINKTIREKIFNEELLNFFLFFFLHMKILSMRAEHTTTTKHFYDRIEFLSCCISHKLMKLAPMKAWKQKQKDLRVKYRPKVPKYVKRSRDRSGKFAILLDSKKTKFAALLRFLSRNLCVVVCSLTLNKFDLRQTSNKFIISPKKHAKQMNKIEVIVDRKQKEKYLRMHEKAEFARQERLENIKAMQELENEIITAESKAAEDKKTREKIKNSIELLRKEDEDKGPKFQLKAAESRQKQIENKKAQAVKVAKLKKTEKLKRKLEVDQKAKEAEAKADVTLRMAKEMKETEDRRKSQDAAGLKISLTIYTCSICNHKFSNKMKYEEHLLVHNDSDSEGELLIDDDVMIVSEEHGESTSNIPSRLIALKSDPEDETLMNFPFEMQEMTSELEELEGPLFPDDPLDDPIPSTSSYPLQSSKYYCNEGSCQMIFADEHALALHIGVCHNDYEKRFKCLKCQEKFSRESALIAHQKMNHPILVIEASPMSKGRRKSVFQSDTPKRRQSVAQASPNPGQSPQSNLRPGPASNIYFKGYNAPKSNAFVCAICSASFPLRNLLDRHMLVHHIKRLYICYVCKASCNSGPELVAHLNNNHPKYCDDIEFARTVKDEESAGIYHCAFCNFCVKVKVRVYQHMNDEHYDKFEKCESPELDQQISSPDSLENLVSPETAILIEEQEEQLRKRDQSQDRKKGAKRIRRPNNDQSFKHRCGRCQRRYATSIGLKTHKCERQFDDTQSSAMNSDPPFTKPVIAPKAQVPQVNGFYQCLFCRNTYTDKEGFDLHVASAH